MFADPRRPATIARARDENAGRMTGPVRLDAGMGRQVSGVVMYAPVYRFGTPATRSARRAALQGWIHAPLDMQAFVDAALRAARRHGSLTIRDGGGEGGGAVLYSDAEDPGANGHDSGDIFSRTLSLDVYGRGWGLGFSAAMHARLAEQLGRETRGEKGG